MADVKITGLPAGAALDGTELVEAVQGGTSVAVELPSQAAQIAVDDSTFANITGTDVQAALADVDGQLGDSGATVSRIVDMVSVHHLHPTDYTTTSTSLVAIDDANLGLSLDLLTGDEVVLELSAPWGESAGGSNVGVDWAVDVPTGADVTGIAVDLGAWASACFVLDTNPAAYGQGLTARAKFTAAEDGTHLFLPRWRVSGSTGRIYQASSNTYETPIVHTAIIRRTS